MTDPEQLPTPDATGPEDGAIPAEGSEGDDESVLDRFRGTGVGVEDPTIVGDPEPGEVDAEVAEDEPPEV